MSLFLELNNMLNLNRHIAFNSYGYSKSNYSESLHRK